MIAVAVAIAERKYDVVQSMPWIGNNILSVRPTKRSSSVHNDIWNE